VRLLDRRNIDIERWDRLVAQSDATVFSTSAYLDAVAQNWCVLVDDEYSKGIAIPYTNRFNVKIAYTPVFLRYVELINGDFDEHVLDLIKSFFPIGELNLRHVTVHGNSKHFQELKSTAQFKLNDQGRRMIRKFESSDLQWEETNDLKLITDVIEAELPKKVVSLHPSFKELVQLVRNLENQGCLKSYIVKKNDLVVGGIFFVQFGGRLLYLKSAFSDEAKKAGAMYYILSEKITHALEQGFVFDFGGSNAENVRRFNLHFGAEDVQYSSVLWGKLPFWYRWIKQLRQVLKAG
jgi:hypothetical protein